MLVVLNGHEIRVEKKQPDRAEYQVTLGRNGLKFVPLKWAGNTCIHLSEGNDKTGPVLALNLPIELTCRHDCECYSEKLCYACGGCYQYSNNQVLYTENLAFFRDHKPAVFVAAVTLGIKASGCGLFRWFTCGDIPTAEFLACMVDIAKNCPGVKFWAYTKKYNIVNDYLDEHGAYSIPDNLCVIFSHWLNRDGSYLEMPNPYNLPTSEFIPLGREELTETVTHICPCSDPDSLEHCANCEHPCYTLKRGESMALLEHSTKETKKRDAETKAKKESKYVVELPAELFND